MIPKITDEQIATMLKAALEFNATVVALATVYYGNMDSKNAGRFRKDYKRLFSEYRSTLKMIFPKEDI